MNVMILKIMCVVLIYFFSSLRRIKEIMNQVNEAMDRVKVESKVDKPTFKGEAIISIP